MAAEANAGHLLYFLNSAFSIWIIVFQMITLKIQNINTFSAKKRYHHCISVNSDYVNTRLEYGQK